jgi:hypothetical protein
MNADEPDAEDRFVEFDAPYVLGALSSADRSAYEIHLAECARCQARVRDLQDVLALLRTVPAEAVEALSATPPPATAMPVRRSRPRWRTVGAGLAVAASMATALALVATSDERRPSRDVPSPTIVLVQLVPVGDAAWTANARLTPVDWGTKIDFECSYAVDWATGALGAYSLVVRDRDGRDVQVAGWLALANRSLRVPGSTSVEADDIAALEVRAPDGTAVLVAQL